MIAEIRARRLSYSIANHLLPLAVSLGLAETFFKFGSFTLECLAFLGLWYVMRAGYARLIGNPESGPHRPSLD